MNVTVTWHIAKQATERTTYVTTEQRSIDLHAIAGDIAGRWGIDARTVVIDRIDL